VSKPSIEFADNQVNSENDSEKRRINSVLAVLAILAKYAETQGIVVDSAATQSYGVDLNCQHQPEGESMAYLKEQQAHEPEKPKPKRLRHTQWSEYNAAQTREKAHFLTLLYELCQTIEEPEQTMGRPRIPLRDIIFSAALKTYTGFSTRRLTSDLKEAQRNGYIEKAPHFNSVYGYLEMKSLTPPLMQIINMSSLPLSSVETTFAVDSSGLSTSQYDQWVKHRYGRPKPVERHKWMKVHIICGTRTHIITGVRVMNGNSGDSPQFIPLVEDTARNFFIDEVSADKAYSAEKNMEAVLEKGGVPDIAFRSNAVSTNRRSGEVWRKMYHFFAYNHQHFMEHYHKRSNVESTFSMLKAKFGGSLRSKTEAAQINEALCKVLCHNICVVIHSIYELGIEPTFWEEPTFCENSASSQKVS
jgi:transposase